MFHRVLRFGMVLAIALVVGVGSGSPLVAQENPDCAGADDFVRAVRTVQLAYNFGTVGIEQGDVRNWTPEELQTAIDSTGNLVSGLNYLVPPPAAAEAHEEIIESYSIWLALLEAVQDSGILAAVPHLEQFTAQAEVVKTTGLSFEETCQIAVIDNDDDGIPEIGAGNQTPAITSAEIDPNAPVGSFQNPVPVGTSQDVGGGWEITVVAVRPDDTQAVLDENMFNEEPIEGRQFFVADVMVTNTGSEPAVFEGNFRLRATGLLGDYRAFAPDDRCGVVANEWEEPEIAPGESVTAAICWSVPAGEVAAIRLFDVDAITETRVYFALAPADGTATPGTATPESGRVVRGG